MSRQVPASELGPILDSQALDKEEKFVADVIMLGCKASEAEGCLKQCEPWSGPETLVLPLQNGVDGLTTIREVVKSWGKGHALAGWTHGNMFSFQYFGILLAE